MYNISLLHTTYGKGRVNSVLDTLVYYCHQSYILITNVIATVWRKHGSFETNLRLVTSSCRAISEGTRVLLAKALSKTKIVNG